MELRTYQKDKRFGEDYWKIREFLLRCGAQPFTYARWDWMITHPSLDAAAMEQIAFWEDAGKTVAMALFDCTLGDVFLQVLPGYGMLYEEMIDYACREMNPDGALMLVIPDENHTLSSAAARHGFIATPQRDCYAAFYPDETSMDYTLPEGFWVTDMEKNFDLYEYCRVLWRGFNHELDGQGPLPYDAAYEAAARDAMLRPNVSLDLKISVRAPDGHAAAYCGMWYDPAVPFAVIEPVATDPDYRKMGLGRAAVLEGIRRAAQKGARFALAGSQQQFYYSIGLRPFSTATKWRRR